jgi:hypothetical protein
LALVGNDALLVSYAEASEHKGYSRKGQQA